MPPTCLPPATRRLSLNIPDFTRFAKSQRAQLVGQSIGLPFFMAAFT